jgi:hypothetical protein
VARYVDAIDLPMSVFTSIAASEGGARSAQESDQRSRKRAKTVRKIRSDSQKEGVA